MIDANEIRRGNWLSNGVKPFQVTDICDTSVNLEYSEGGGHNWIYDLEDDCFPIELSPEVLLACGFHKHNNAWVQEEYDEDNYDKDYFTIWNIKDGEFNLNTSQFPVVLTSLHQLMNVYFSLTGKELIYNPIK